MASINASTKHTVSVPKPAVKKTSMATTTKAPLGGVKKATTTAAATAAGRRGAVAPKLKPGLTVVELDKIVQMTIDDKKKELVHDIYRQCIGEHTTLHLDKPHAASTTRDRSAAAADLAYITKHCGLPYIMIECQVLSYLQNTLFPSGIEQASIFANITNTTNNIETKSMASSDDDDIIPNTDGNNDKKKKDLSVAVLKPSASAISLSSMVDQWTLDSDDPINMVIDDDNKSKMTNESMQRGNKVTPPNAREGCYLLIRSLIETVGKAMEPYVVGAFLSSSIEECASSNSHVREAAEDTSTAIVSISNQYIFSPIIIPLLLHYIQYNNEWRIKSCALERLIQCTTLYPKTINHYVPILLPILTSQVWDTKVQVSKAAKAALSAVCYTNLNKDIQPTIPSIINAICKPAETNKAISDLMGTTFVVAIDAPVLAMLCPLLSRGLKEKLAIHKRSACLVTHNMSKLVQSPAAIEPFSNLLVPELQRVIQNVQFNEIREEALKALASLTKALGTHYQNKQNSQKADGQSEIPIDTIAVPNHQHHHSHSQLATTVSTSTTVTNTPTTNTEVIDELLRENQFAELEQERIKKEKEIELALQEEQRKKEEEERKRFKEAMDAQRELDKIANAEHTAKKQSEELARVKQRLSTNSAGGQCQSCGFKKCKKTCMFYKG